MFKGLSINFHLWEGCNMRCGYCFNSRNSVVNPKKDDQLKIIDLLSKACFSKISFVGGEPTLCPWLSELAEISMVHNITNMLITNGSKLDNVNLSLFNWVGISVDSLDPFVNNLIGRSDNLDYVKLASLVKKNGCKLKINTVVSRFNFTHDFNEFISATTPNRWKIMQILKINNRNNKTLKQYEISDEEFNHFTDKHKSECISIEKSEAMINSYIMIDSEGRFISNNLGKYIKSKSILDVGVEKAFQQIHFSFDKYKQRQDTYWN